MPQQLILFLRIFVSLLQKASGGNPCDTCYASLPLIAEEFNRQCGDSSARWLETISHGLIGSELMTGMVISGQAVVKHKKPAW